MRQVTLQSITLALLIFAGLSAQAQEGQRPAAPPPTFDQIAARAEQARAASRNAEAIELYRQALALRPRWDEGWFNLGTLLYEGDDYSGAAEAFQHTTELNAKVGTAWAMLGLCEFKLGRHDDALDHLRRARSLGVSANSNLSQVTAYHEGLLLLGKGEFEAAQSRLNTVSRDGVGSPDLIVALGLSALRLRPAELNGADAAMRDVVSRAGLAQHLAAQKKFAEATQTFEQLAKDYPRTPNVHLAYARFLLTNNETEKALPVLGRELENNPRHLLARLYLADAKLKLRDYAGGLPHAEEAVKLRPNLPLAHYLLGSLLLGAGDTARAITELEAARAGEPNDSKIYFALGSAYARAGRKEDAERARAAFTRLSKEEEAAAANQP